MFQQKKIENITNFSRKDMSIIFFVAAQLWNFYSRKAWPLTFQKRYCFGSKHLRSIWERSSTYTDQVTLLWDKIDFLRKITSFKTNFACPIVKIWSSIPSDTLIEKMKFFFRNSSLMLTKKLNIFFKKITLLGHQICTEK